MKDRKHKKYVPKRVIVPLTKAGHDTKAMELHAYVETAIHNPCVSPLANWMGN